MDLTNISEYLPPSSDSMLVTNQCIGGSMGIGIGTSAPATSVENLTLAGSMHIPSFDGHGGTATTTSSRAGQELLRLSQKSEQSAESPGPDDEANIVIATQLSGKFFVSESPWAQLNAGTENVELTCYRRNLFSVYGVVVIPEGFSPFTDGFGERISIVSLSAQLSALENLNNRPVKLVYIPERKVSATEHVPTYTDHKPIALNVDFECNQLPTHMEFPVCWNRLQFRHATSKNQRRGTLQQTYHLEVCVVATLTDNSTVVLTKAVSIPIVVRGSSPGSFQLRKGLIPQTKPAPSVTTSHQDRNLDPESHMQAQMPLSNVADEWYGIFGPQEMPDLASLRNDHDFGQANIPGVFYDSVFQAYSTGTSPSLNLSRPDGATKLIQFRKSTPGEPHDDGG